MSGTSSIQITTASGVTKAVTTLLSGSASGLNFPQVSIYDDGVPVGIAGVYNGQWTITVAPSQGANTYTATGGTSLDPGLASNAVVLTDIREPPTVTIGQGGGNTDTTVQTLSGTVTTAGYGALFTAGTAITLSDDGAVVGKATVAADGTWSARIALTSQGSNVVTVAATDIAGNAGEADAIFALKTSVPAVSITSAGGTVTRQLQVISGSATAGDTGDTVTVTEDGSAIGSASVGVDGTWALVTTLAAGTHVFQATDADLYGNVGTSNAVAYTLDPAVAFGPAPSLSGTVATLTGTASPAGGIARVEIYDGATDLGAAQVGAGGAWAFTHDFGQGSYDALRAVVTDAAGTSAVASALFDIDTAARGRRYTGEVTARDASGAITSVTTMASDGAIGAQTVSNRDGTATSTGYESGQALVSIGNDVMTGNGYRENFVFGPTTGHARITDFVVAGAGHDTVTLSHADFDTVAQVLNQTTMSHGSALIHVSPDDTIRLAGVTKAQLVQHRGDFAFTG